MRGGEILTLSTLTHSGEARTAEGGNLQQFKMPLCAICLEMQKRFRRAFNALKNDTAMVICAVLWAFISVLEGF